MGKWKQSHWIKWIKSSAWSVHYTKRICSDWVTKFIPPRKKASTSIKSFAIKKCERNVWILFYFSTRSADKNSEYFAMKLKFLVETFLDEKICVKCEIPPGIPKIHEHSWKYKDYGIHHIPARWLGKNLIFKYRDLMAQIHILGYAIIWYRESSKYVANCKLAWNDL